MNLQLSVTLHAGRGEQSRTIRIGTYYFGFVAMRASGESLPLLAGFRGGGLLKKRGAELLLQNCEDQLLDLATTSNAKHDQTRICNKSKTMKIYFKGCSELRT